ncbi:DUF6879 family protein [Bailinhaonella thermotolerans]|uniref:DUF6879 domain-containing protein n=1 Tax=Bailinhaonella thermotolerans TaxID=1070861 RepID=A0A3A4AJU4_9ACTN|nr:DUF6879 family protein [Bailinhaonella thermotolerans]RJL21205.1 hypothetical protein D5H75_37700 [Bailinhaonella thermotolerans]
MDLISIQRRGELISSSRTSLKLELRDNYAVDAEALEVWRRHGAAEARKLIQPYADKLAAQIAAGEKKLRRVKVLSRRSDRGDDPDLAVSLHHLTDRLLAR